MDRKQTVAPPVESLQFFSGHASNRISTMFYTLLNPFLTPLYTWDCFHYLSTTPQCVTDLLNLGCLPPLKQVTDLGVEKQSSNTSTLIEKETERQNQLVTSRSCSLFLSMCSVFTTSLIFRTFLMLK